MKQYEFNKLWKETEEVLHGLASLKGHEYADETDVLDNFKTAAKEVQTAPEQVWFTYFYKHYAALRRYVQSASSGKEIIAAEPIEGRIHDLIVYLFLMLAMVEERKSNERVSLTSAEDAQLHHDKFFKDPTGGAQ